jgi:hypothetical protein
MIKKISVKLGNMRKPENFVVYPRRTNADENDNSLMIQSSHRICKFDATTGVGVLSAYKSNGAYGVHLNKLLGAMDVVVPPEVIAAAKESQPRSGDVIGSSPMTGVVTIA